MFQYNQGTKFACVTYKDNYSAKSEALTDLKISFDNNVFAAGKKRLEGFKPGDYVMICADDNKKKFGFLAQIVEKLDIVLNDWVDRGGKEWEFNFLIRSITPIMDLSAKSTIRTQMKEIASLLKASLQEAPDRVSAIIEERKKFERDLADARKKLAMGGGGSSGASDVTDINGITYLGRRVDGVEMKDLKGLADEAKAQVGSGIIALVNVGEDGKAGLVVAVTSDLTSRFNAVELVRVGAEALGGKGGGGRPDMAQAGGPDGDKADQALHAIASLLRSAG